MEPGDENVGEPNQEDFSIDQIVEGPESSNQVNNPNIPDQSKEAIKPQDIIPTFIIRIILWAILFLAVDLAVPGLYYLVAEEYNDIYIFITGFLFVISLLIIILLEYYRLVKPDHRWKECKILLQSFYLSVIISPVEALVAKGYFLDKSYSVVLVLLIINTVICLLIGNYFSRPGRSDDKQKNGIVLSEEVSVNKVHAMHSSLKTFGIVTLVVVALLLIGAFLFVYLLFYVGQHPNGSI